MRRFDQKAEQKKKKNTEADWKKEELLCYYSDPPDQRKILIFFSCFTASKRKKKFKISGPVNYGTAIWDFFYVACSLVGAYGDRSSRREWLRDAGSSTIAERSRYNRVGENSEHAD